MNEELTAERPAANRDRAMIVSGDRGIQLRSLDDFYRFSQYVIAARMAPKGIENEAGVLIAIQRGAEVGLLPMQALQSVYLVNNQPHLFGDAPLAIVEASGLLEDREEYEDGRYPDDTYGWVCKVKRRGRKTRLSKFSIADAKTAQLWDKKSASGIPSPWVLYPKRMLMWRARGYALRDEFPDVLKGFPIRELYDDEAAAFDQAKPAVGQVVEPHFSKAEESPGRPAVSAKSAGSTGEPEAPKRRGRPPKAREPEQAELPKTDSLFAANPEADPAPVPESKPEALGLVDEVANRLATAGLDQTEFLMLLQYVGLLKQGEKDVDPDEIRMGHYVLADVPDAALTEALKDWGNVESAGKAKVWKK
jgi:hypothetical protein